MDCAEANTDPGNPSSPMKAARIAFEIISRPPGAAHQRGARNACAPAAGGSTCGSVERWEFVVVRDRDLLRRLSAIDGANAGHLASAAAGIAIVIHKEVPDLDAYDES